MIALVDSGSVRTLMNVSTYKRLNICKPTQTKSPGVAEVLLESDMDGLTRNYSDVFYDEECGLQEATGLLPMRIETTGDPVYQRPYRAALTKRQVI